MYALTYSITLLGSKSLLDRSIPLDNRLLSPVHHAVMILLIYALSGLWNSRRAVLRATVGVVSLGLVILYAYRGIELGDLLYKQGLGYASRGWHRSDTLQLLRSRSGTPIYSNASAAIYLWTGVVSQPTVNAELMRQAAQENCALIVVFDSIPLELYGVSEAEIAPGLEKDRKRDATIYAHPACSESD